MSSPFKALRRFLNRDRRNKSSRTPTTTGIGSEHPVLPPLNELPSAQNDIRYPAWSESEGSRSAEGSTSRRPSRTILQPHGWTETQEWLAHGNSNALAAILEARDQAESQLQQHRAQAVQFPLLLRKVKKEIPVMSSFSGEGSGSDSVPSKQKHVSPDPTEQELTSSTPPRDELMPAIPQSSPRDYEELARRRAEVFEGMKANLANRPTYEYTLDRELDKIVGLTKEQSSKAQEIRYWLPLRDPQEEDRTTKKVDFTSWGRPTVSDSYNIPLAPGDPALTTLSELNLPPPALEVDVVETRAGAETAPTGRRRTTRFLDLYAPISRENRSSLHLPGPDPLATHPSTARDGSLSEAQLPSAAVDVDITEQRNSLRSEGVQFNIATNSLPGTEYRADHPSPWLPSPHDHDQMQQPVSGSANQGEVKYKGKEVDSAVPFFADTWHISDNRIFVRGPESEEDDSSHQESIAINPFILEQRVREEAYATMSVAGSSAGASGPVEGPNATSASRVIDYMRRKACASDLPNAPGEH